ncbi:hypothetical protein T492DRAFT_931304 [Pavlovales sp. CCMP2436]|nr:hypothetical protein T492DRAFT_931304 [Pavlovales sp. CCMP2436]
MADLPAPPAREGRARPTSEARCALEASDFISELLAAAAASLAVGVAYGVRAAGDSGELAANGSRLPFPKAGEQFGVRRAFHAFGYATAIVGVGAAIAVHVVCTNLDAWTARDFATAMRARLAAPRMQMQAALLPASAQMQAALHPASAALGVATKKYVHADFDQMVVGLQRRLFVTSPSPAASSEQMQAALLPASTQMQAALEPASAAAGVATKKYVHTDFDQMVVGLQRRLLGTSPSPAVSSEWPALPGDEPARS